MKIIKTIIGIILLILASLLIGIDTLWNKFRHKGKEAYYPHEIL